jgi:hypothetical protein
LMGGARVFKLWESVLKTHPTAGGSISPVAGFRVWTD